MADYQSTLTGQQMDDALLQMNQRLPEQWTTGQIDGVDVPSTNPRYHNNAKYYSQQAEQNAEDIEDLTVSSTTLPAGSQATATKTHPTGQPYNIAFGIPQGATGNGIASITKTSTVGKVDTYTITFTDGTTTTFTVTNGQDGSGTGDMLKATYDTDNNGIVDNAEKLGGQLPSYYSSKSSILTGTLLANGWNNNEQELTIQGLSTSGYAYTVSPDSSDFTNYAEAMIYAEDVTVANKMNFVCSSTPSSDIDIVILKCEVV